MAAEGIPEGLGRARARGPEPVHVMIHKMILGSGAKAGNFQLPELATRQFDDVGVDHHRERPHPAQLAGQTQDQIVAGVGVDQPGQADVGAVGVVLGADVVVATVAVELCRVRSTIECGWQGLEATG